jgi:hypothetical protein
MEAYVKYLIQITELRDETIRGSNIKFVEGLKIWARWLITHISLFDPANRHTILPTDDIYDHQFIHELMSQGISAAEAERIYKDLQEKKNALLPMCPADLSLSEISISRYDDTNVCLRYEGIKHCISVKLYGKLKRLYNRWNHHGHHADVYIWLTLTLYQILDGHSLQWAVPPSVMWLFKEKLNCTTDIFASPLNAYNARYYSLFQSDHHFGSLGNFFTAPDEDFTEGTFHINPPFIISLFTKTTNRILQLLKKAEQAEKGLTFIYIMPDWDHFEAYNKMYMNRYGKKHIYIPPGQAYYYQYRTDSYILATFGTHVFILSTREDPLPADLEADIIAKFAEKPVLP